MAGESLKLRRFCSDSTEGRDQVGEPCYTFGGKNVVLIAVQGFTSLLFFKGRSCDPKGCWLRGQVQVGRQMRFTGLRQLIR